MVVLQKCHTHTGGSQTGCDHVIKVSHSYQVMVVKPAQKFNGFCNRLITQMSTKKDDRLSRQFGYKIPQILIQATREGT